MICIDAISIVDNEIVELLNRCSKLEELVDSLCLRIMDLEDACNINQEENLN